MSTLSGGLPWRIWAGQGRAVSLVVLAMLATALQPGSELFGQGATGSAASNTDAVPATPVAPETSANSTSATSTATGATPLAGQVQLTVENLIGAFVDDIGPRYRDIDDGIDLFLKGDVVGARNYIDRAVKNNPHLPPTSMLMARMYMMANNVRGSQAELDRAVTEAPDDPEVYIIQGDISLQRNEPTPAQLLYDRGLAKLQTYTANEKRKKALLQRVYSGLAFVAQNASDWAGAEKYLREWLKVDPENNNARSRLGNTLFRQGTNESKQAAYTVFNEIWKSDPANQLRPEVVVAQLFDQVDKDTARAKTLMEKVQKLDPGLQTQLAVAHWAMESNEMQLARTAAAAAEAADAKALEAKLISGLLARHEGRPADALKNFVDAHVQSPSNPIALNQIAQILIESTNADDHRRATEYAQVAATIYARFDQNYARESAITYAWVLHRIGKSREAGQVIKSVLEQPGNIDSSSVYFAAEILHALGQDEPAKRLLDAILGTGKNFVNRDKARELRKALP